MTTKLRYFLAALVITLPLDQISKQWIIANFHYGEREILIPGILDFTHVRNPGGAFSFFADGPLEQRMLFFVGTTLIAIVLLLVFLKRLEGHERLSAIALGTILGGAMGNLIDRLVYSEVIDFIDVHLWGGYTWPTFNLADSFIVVGVALLMIEIFLNDEGEEGAEEGQASPTAGREETG
ncbi:MAG: signal peptidase II [Deltaproteobacteria bacterium]|nr:signal peptidase II [Deltaproteobacteria bacterium]MBW2418199.1 signal peptidase II [Deltaproteobacteria bacterium]